MSEGSASQGEETAQTARGEGTTAEPAATDNAGERNLETVEIVTTEVTDDGTIMVDDLVAEVDDAGNIVATDELVEIDLPDGTIIVDETFSVADESGDLVVVDEETTVLSPQDESDGPAAPAAESNGNSGG